MKSIVLVVFVFSIAATLRAQNHAVDSIRAVARQQDPRFEIWILNSVGRGYVFSRSDSGLFFAKQALALAYELKSPLEIAESCQGREQGWGYH